MNEYEQIRDIEKCERVYQVLNARPVYDSTFLCEHMLTSECLPNLQWLICSLVIVFLSTGRALMVNVGQRVNKVLI
jgi:hypothetical protein